MYKNKYFFRIYPTKISPQPGLRRFVRYKNCINNGVAVKIPIQRTLPIYAFVQFTNDTVPGQLVSSETTNETNLKLVQECTMIICTVREFVEYNTDGRDTGYTGKLNIISPQYPNIVVTVYKMVYLHRFVRNSGWFSKQTLSMSVINYNNYQRYITWK